MAGVYSLATLFNKLYDVVAVFGFYNLRYFFGVVEIECHGCILSHKIGTPFEADFAAAHRTAVVFGV